MDKNKLHKECMGIINQLFDLAEVPVEKRQSINDTADKYLQEQFLRLSAVSGRSEQLVCDSYYANNLSMQKECLNCGKLSTEH